MNIYINFHSVIFKRSEKRLKRHRYSHSRWLIIIRTSAKIIIIQHHSHIAYPNFPRQFYNAFIFRICKRNLNTHMLIHKIIAFMPHIGKFSSAMAVKLFLCITCLNIHAVNPVFIHFEFMCNLLFIKWLNTDCILCRINERTVFIAYRPFNIKVISTVRLRMNRIYCIVNIRTKFYFLALKKYITYMLFRISSNIYTAYGI